MRKKLAVLIVVFAFINVITATTLFVSGKSDGLPIPLTGPDAIDASVEMLGEKEIAIRKHAAEVGSAIATGASLIGDPVMIGWEEEVDVGNFDPDEPGYTETFVVLMDGTHGIILIEKEAYLAYDSSTDEYVFPNPNNVWRDEDRISTAQLAYLLNEFDTNIYPTCTGIYGNILPRGAEGDKVWILIHNIRDESYYDPTQTSYVAGYFSAAENSASEENKNMFHIDSYDWGNRVGPYGGRPYLYEGTFAHEFEHMIHFDQDPDEPSWVDEGLADLAGYFCGYGHSSGHLAYYMVYHPWTALTFWGNQLEDYGACYLFQFYLYENFGGATFTTALVQNPFNGIAGIEDTLASFGYDLTFDEVFDAWTIANYLDAPWEGDAPLRYGYDALTIGSIDTWGYSIEYVMNEVWGEPVWSQNTYGIWPIEIPGGYWWAEPMPYTPVYWRFGGQPTLAVQLLGEDSAGTPAYSGQYEWYSDMVIWAWHSLKQTFTIPAGGATLEFMTYFEIEHDWDYVYVEVNDNGEWYTLEAPGITTTELPEKQDNPNCPIDREPETYFDNNRWHAFTGESGEWIPISMDLTPFAGKTIDLYFTSWQDGAFTLQGMYIDDIQIDAVPFFFDDVEAGEDGWTKTGMTSGWVRTTGIIGNNWQGTLIETLWQPTKRYPNDQNWNARKLLAETHMDMFSSGTWQVGWIEGIPATPASTRHSQVLIVSNRANHILTSDYIVQFGNTFL